MSATELEPELPHWDSPYAQLIRQIEQPYTLTELRAKIDSNEYGAELLLQHAMRLLEDVVHAARPALRVKLEEALPGDAAALVAAWKTLHDPDIPPANRYVRAVTAYRNASGYDLRQSKDVVDGLKSGRIKPPVREPNN